VLHHVDLLEHHAGAAHHARQRIVGYVDGHLRRFGDALVQDRQQRATTGQDDALVHDVGDEFWRRLLDCVPDDVHDQLERRIDGLADLLAADLDAAGQAGQEVAAAEGHALVVPLAGAGGPEGDLDVFRRPLTQEEVVLAPGVGNDVLVQLVAANSNAPAHDYAAEADDGDLGCAAADVHDQAAGRLIYRQAGADRGRHGFFDQA